jgi:hypothetical protein
LASMPVDRPRDESHCCRRATVGGRRRHASRHARDGSSRSSLLTTHAIRSLKVQSSKSQSKLKVPRRTSKLLLHFDL